MALYYDTLVEAPSEEAPPVVSNWIAERSSQREWLTVEIGHGIFSQAWHEAYEDNRYYVGVEAWHWDGDEDEFNEDWLARTVERSPNAVFAGLGTESCSLSEKPDEPERVLSPARMPCVVPDGVADEVLMSNVLNDPDSDPSSVVTEAMRMTAPGGCLVFYADMTPWEYQYAHLLAEQTGFSEEAFIHGDQAGFKALQELYKPDHKRVYKADYCLILRRLA